MSFIVLILKNLFRSKTRTILTIFGITIGITVIITMSVITEGMKDSFGSALKAGGADFTIGEAKSADMMFSAIEEEKVDEVKKEDGVKEAVGVVMQVAQQKDVPYFMVFGVRQEDLDLIEYHAVEGREFKKGSKDEISIGKLAASNFEKEVGDTIKLGTKKYKVTGIYETGNMIIDGGAVISLEAAQKQFKRANKVSMILVKVEKDANVDEVAKNIEKKHKDELVTIKSVEEVSKVDQGIIIMEGLTWAISFIAVLIGGIGVMNTILMSVFERTREIGVLRALGWKKRRVIIMILGETFVISLIAVIFGLALGSLLVQAIASAPQMQGFLKPLWGSFVFSRAIGVAFIVALVGSLYPALRAARLSPLEALRYE
jgi:putative ABC transport system permease protein